MKKMPVLRTILSVTLAVFLLCGCGNSTDETATSEDVPEVVEPVEAPDTEEKEEVTKPAEKEETKQEEVVEEPTEETYNGMPVAKVATTVSDIYAFLDYAESLGEPALLIYNESEGYVINMGEGEYYQLKKDDRIFEYDSSKAVSTSDTLKAGSGKSERAYVFEMTPDYTKFDKPHEVLYAVSFTGEWEKEGDYFLLTCYLDAPAE